MEVRTMEIRTKASATQLHWRGYWFWKIQWTISPTTTMEKWAVPKMISLSTKPQFVGGNTSRMLRTYGISTYIYTKFQPNIGNYSIHPEQYDAIRMLRKKAGCLSRKPQTAKWKQEFRALRCTQPWPFHPPNVKRWSPWHWYLEDHPMTASGS